MARKASKQKVNGQHSAHLRPKVTERRSVVRSLARQVGYKCCFKIRNVVGFPNLIRKYKV